MASSGLPSRPSGSPTAFRLSALQSRLAQLAGEALQRTDEDPVVYFIDPYGGRHEVADLRLGFAPQSLEEADQDVRHPEIDLLPKEWSS